METPKHSPFPWRQTPDCVIVAGEGDNVVAVAYASKEDGKIIVSACNNLYGAGINPEAIHDMYAALIIARDYLRRQPIVGPTQKAIEAAIEKAKLSQ